MGTKEERAADWRKERRKDRKERVVAGQDQKIYQKRRKRPRGEREAGDQTKCQRKPKLNFNNRPEEKEKFFEGRQEQKGHNKTKGRTGKERGDRQGARRKTDVGEREREGRRAERKQTSKKPEEHWKTYKKIFGD